MSNWVPETQLEKALCPTSLAKTLGLQRQDYWGELNPILKKWKNVNDGRCPECARPIRVNMARHLRLVHTKYVCFWRCPVLSCSLWFTSELNAKDHIEGIHHFKSPPSKQTGWSGSGAGHSLTDDRRPRPSGWTTPVGPGAEEFIRGY